MEKAVYFFAMSPTNLLGVARLFAPLIVGRLKVEKIRGNKASANFCTVKRDALKILSFHCDKKVM